MKFYIPFTAALLCLGLIVAIAPAQKKINYTEMVEDIEVMCRIVDKSMKENFKKEYQSAGLLGWQGCQGFYLKGYGVVFLLNVQFPVADKQIKVVKKEKSTDLWDKYEREVRRQPGLQEAELVTEDNKAYNQDKVDKLKEHLARIVGQYGGRLGQLESDDRISIVVSGQLGHMPGVAWATSHRDDAFFPHAPEVEWSHSSSVQEFHFEHDSGRKHDVIQHKTKIVGDDVAGDLVVETEPATEGDNGTPQKVRKIVSFPTVPVIARINQFGFHGTYATTMIVVFNRSMLRNKTAADWESVLRSADIVQY